MNFIKRAKQYASRNSAIRIQYGRLRLAFTLILLAGLWAAFAGLVVPSIIERA